MSPLRRALAANLVPALFLWFVAVFLLVLYGRGGATREVFDHLAALKTQLGPLFTMPAQACAAALFPFLFQRFQRGTHRKTRLAHLPYLMLFFACLGALTDAFYGFQAQIFGNNAQLSSIAPKVAVDMLLYTPFIANPLVVWAFALKDCSFSLAKTRQALGKTWFRDRVTPIYRVALFIWTPAVAVIYALPLGVQFPFQALISCLWGLMIVVLTDK